MRFLVFTIGPALESGRLLCPLTTTRVVSSFHDIERLCSERIMPHANEISAFD
jgi:hypothetical protein